MEDKSISPPPAPPHVVIFYTIDTVLSNIPAVYRTYLVEPVCHSTVCTTVVTHLLTVYSRQTRRVVVKNTGTTGTTMGGNDLFPFPPLPPTAKPPFFFLNYLLVGGTVQYFLQSSAVQYQTNKQDANMYIRTANVIY